jgi:hypothetical protein
MFLPHRMRCLRPGSMKCVVPAFSFHGEGSWSLLVQQEDKMHKIRCGFIVMSMLLCWATSAAAEVRVGIGIGFPHVSIGINLPVYPELVPVPGYPVYYAPRLHANYFFYDGLYWVFQGDNWYASSWYNGPWWFVEPASVPLFVLRIPVRYYRQPPVYFRGWYPNAPPRWGQHWGREWEHRRPGWDRWQRSASPPRAPLPVYQRHYSGSRYPRVEHQHTLRSQQYRYQPRDPVVRQNFQRQFEQRPPAPAQLERREVPGMQRPIPSQPPSQQRGPAIQNQRQQPGTVQRGKQVPRSGDREREKDRDRNWDRGPGQSRDDDRSRGRD